MKVLIFSNIPSPYRIDFFNELGKNIELTVVFEAKTANGIKFNWNIDQIHHFNAIFLKDGDINEKKIDWSILKYVKKNKYDHIIVTSYAYLTEMVALIALKILKIPYFMEIDGGLIRKENVLKKRLKSFLISNASGYFSPSKSSDDYLVYYGAKKDLIFRYPFTSLKERDIIDELISKEEKIELRKELGITEKKVILAVGQFIHRKGFDVLLKACRELDNEIAIIFVGGIPTNEYNEFKNRYNLRNVHFEGFKTKEELHRYFKAADIFVLPTREDVWGLVINEAMGFGLPIISTNKCVAALELVNNNENGYIVEVNDHKSIYKSIVKILGDDDLRTQMSWNSLQTIKKYTIENMAGSHLSVFLNICKDKYKKDGY
ncbi:TPA: glycosyltransferase family 4 protein [Streptococcus suis]|nr:glycosyltransferase family 4 protein [Streptococcus suis]